MVISNASDLTAYDVVVTIVRVNDVQSKTVKAQKQANCDRRAHFQVLPPGKYIFTGFKMEDFRGMNTHFAVEIAFRDAQGNSWIRYSNGKLKHTLKSPSSYYKLEKPFSYSNLDRV